MAKLSRQQKVDKIRNKIKRMPDGTGPHGRGLGPGGGRKDGSGLKISKGNPYMKDK